MNKWIKSKSNIKEMLAIIMALAILITGAFSLVSCGQDDQSSTSETSKESEFITESQPESEEQSSSQGGSEIESEAESSSESAVESESQSQSTESVTESETQSESTETATESEIESETNSESETESESESTTESETESEVESETESESESESQNPTTVAEWVTANSDEINAFMNTNYLTTFGKATFGVRFNEANVVETSWVFDGEESINQIQLVCKYKASDNSYWIMVGTFNSDAPIDKNTMLSDSTLITSTNITSDYKFNYTPSIQGTRDELVTALFKAVGVNEVGGERYIKELGQSAAISGLGMANGFTIVEVGENGIKEYTIYINVADDDAGYIAKLANSSEYKISGISKEIDISGTKVK